MAEPNFFDQFDPPAADGGSGPLVVTVRPQRPTQAAPVASGGNYFDQFDAAPTGEMSTDNVARSFARGVPIIGGALNHANAATNAFVDGLMPDAIVRAIGGERIPGKNFSERYENELKRQQEMDRAFEEKNPITSKATELVGGVVGTIPMVMAAPAAFGVGSGPLALRTGASAITGAGVAGADGAVRSGGDLDVTGKSALVGFGAGAVSPIAGEGIGHLARLGRVWWGGRNAQMPAQVGNMAADMLADDVAAAGGAQAVRGRLSDLGPDAMLLDASPSFMGRAQGLAVLPETRETVMAPLMQRQAGANRRLLSDMDSIIGPTPVPSRVEAGLAEGRQAVGDAYEGVFQNARPIRTARLAETLDRMAVNLRGDTRRSVVNARNMLNEPGGGALATNPRALFAIRNELDGLIGVEKNDRVLSQLGFVRQAVDDYLRAAVPGIKEVDARFQELARQSEGLKRGSSIMDSGKTATRPVELAAEVTAGTQPDGLFIGPSGETFRMRQGARAEIDRQLGTKANDLVALRNVIKGDGDWNRAKLAEVFGEGEAARIFGAVDREAAFNDAYKKIVENSQTQMRADSAAAMRPRAGGEGAGSLNDVGTGIAAVAGGAAGAGINLAARGVRLSANQIQRAAELARNGELADVLVKKSGPELDLLIKTLENRIGLKAAGDSAAEKAALLAQILIQAQGSRGSRNLPERWR
jgi:hypothetical protein